MIVKVDLQHILLTFFDNFFNGTIDYRYITAILPKLKTHLKKKRNLINTHTTQMEGNNNDNKKYQPEIKTVDEIINGLNISLIIPDRRIL